MRMETKYIVTATNPDDLPDAESDEWTNELEHCDRFTNREVAKRFADDRAKHSNMIWYVLAVQLVSTHRGGA